MTAVFSEELDTHKSVMQVFHAGDQQVSAGNGKVDLNNADHKTMIASLPAPLPAGLYTVKWHVYLTDGDESSGTFAFTVAATAAAAQVTATPAATATASPTPAESATPAPTTAANSTAGTATAQPQATPVAPQSLPATGAALGWLLPVGLLIVAVGSLLLLRVAGRAGQDGR